MKYVLLLMLPLAFSCTQKMKALKSEVEVRQVKPTVTMTASVRTQAELPRCDEGSSGMNAFVSGRDRFVQCRNGAWRDVKPGDTSGTYIAREPIRYNEWIDASARRRWALPKQEEIQLIEVKNNVCSQGWKLPTHEELLEASMNGLFEGIKSRGGVAFEKAWTANMEALTGISQGTLKALMPGSDEASKAGVYCVASLN